MVAVAFAIDVAAILSFFLDFETVYGRSGKEQQTQENHDVWIFVID